MILRTLLLSLFFATAVAQGESRTQKIEVEKGVTLEVIDWGGTGRPIVLLAGLGDTARALDTVALKLTPYGHIYGITRRGFGASTGPTPPSFDATPEDDGTYEYSRHDLSEPNPYEADRLGDDVLAVIDALKLFRPVLIGHSVAGEELSSVGSRHPEKVAGFVYLDALQPYAFFNGTDEEWAPNASPRFLGRRLPDLMLAVAMGRQKYSKLPVPILAIVSFPRPPPPNARDYEAATAAEKKRLDSLEHDIPTARIVRLPHADHRLWTTNEAEVMEEIRAFLSRLH